MRFNRSVPTCGHLQLVNLKSLDLSCNYIEKIEGLETLTQLKVLKLYFNNISKLEGLEKYVSELSSV
jgi:Leucine-rich repeat (LRR) protein